MSNSVHRTYTVRFNGRPTVLQIQDELKNAAQSMHQYSRVVVETNGSSDPELEEVTFMMVNDR